jgi:chromosomal replication initiation ATPase DnaA
MSTVFAGVRSMLPKGKPRRRRDWLLVASDDVELPPTVQRILAVVSRECGFSPRHVASMRRNPNLVLIRHIWWYLAVKLTGKSLTQIGRACGNRDHTSIMYARDRITSLREIDFRFDAKITALEVAARNEPRREAFA